MHLVDRDQLTAGSDRRNGSSPILADRLAIVLAAVADVEARKVTRGNAASSAEEAVRNVAEADCPDDLHFAHRLFRMMTSSST
jgi:hypothetical protein